MSGMCRGLSVFCAFVFFSSAYCSNESYVGLLTSNCVVNYYRIFVSRTVPPRNYLYFHEALSDEMSDVDDVEDDEVDVRFRIVGGNQVPIELVPYQALYGLYCGGVIIAPNWIITAAHCKDKEKFVLAGSTQRSETTSYTICAHFVHPLFNKTGLNQYDFDYQLLLLEYPIPVTPKSRPIAIGNEQDIQDGAIITVSGWGHTKYKQRAMQDIVHRVHFPVIPKDVCRSLPLKNFRTVTDRQFCGGLLNGTKDACQGDSGGPAVINGKLVGVVSFGVNCAKKDQPGVYSNIPLVRGWIRAITGLPL